MATNYSQTFEILDLDTGSDENSGLSFDFDDWDYTNDFSDQANAMLSSINAIANSGDFSADKINEPIKEFHENFSSTLAMNAQLSLEQRTSDIEAYVAGTQESRTGVIQDSIQQVQNEMQQTYLSNLAEVSMGVSQLLQSGISTAMSLQADVQSQYLSSVVSAYGSIMQYLANEMSIDADIYSAQLSNATSRYNTELSAEATKYAAEQGSNATISSAEYSAEADIAESNNALTAALAEIQSQQNMLDTVISAASASDSDVWNPGTVDTTTGKLSYVGNWWDRENY